MNIVRDEMRGEITQRQKEAYQLFELGDYEGCMAVLEAEEMHRKAIEIFERLSENQTEVYEQKLLGSYISLALTYKNMKEYSNTDIYRIKALRLLKNIPIIHISGIDIVTLERTR